MSYFQRQYFQFRFSNLQKLEIDLENKEAVISIRNLSHHLTHLSLHCEFILSGILSQLMPSLKSLVDLKVSPISNVDTLNAIGQLSQLKSLTIGYIVEKIFDPSTQVKFLSQLSQLDSLDTSLDLTTQVCQNLKSLKQIKMLQLCECTLRDV